MNKLSIMSVQTDKCLADYSMIQAVISITASPQVVHACMCLNLCMHIALIDWLFIAKIHILVFLLSNATLQVVKHASLVSPVPGSSETYMYYSHTHEF